MPKIAEELAKFAMGSWRSQLDALDRRILREVQKDCSCSGSILAERCGTTQSTLRRRIKRLRDNGTISAEVAVVNGSKVGRGLILFVTVRLEKDDAKGVKSFVARIAGHPDVLQFFFITGSSDYLIMLCVRDMEDYDRFVQENLVSNPVVVLSDTNVVIRPLKLGLAIPVDEPTP